MTSPTPPAPETVVTLKVVGHLDEVAGQALMVELLEALAHKPDRIDVDLAGVTGYTEEGAARLAACRDLTSTIPGGLHFRTEGGAGQEALLMAFAEG